MSIVTKNGDKGKTSSYQGKKVYKDNLRVEVSGNIDEVSSYLGFAKACSKSKRIKNIIEDTQKDLFLVGTKIALEFKEKKANKKYRKIPVEKIENLIKGLESKIKLKNDFYLPGENLCSASLDLARAIARKAERRAVSLNRRRLFKNKNILIYLNRLSDFLFLLARSSEKKL